MVHHVAVPPDYAPVGIYQRSLVWESKDKVHHVTVTPDYVPEGIYQGSRVWVTPADDEDHDGQDNGP